MYPYFSIITVVLNGEKHLEQTINSVLNQDYADYEYIIVDGGSTDGTLGIIQKYEDRITKWISEKDSGIYEAMNKGIRFAKGDFVSFLNSDDFYLPGTLQKVADIIRNNNADIYHGNVLILDDKNTIADATLGHHTGDVTSLGIGGFLYQPSAFTKKIVFDRIGFFNDKLKIVSDYDFFLRASKHNFLFYRIEEPLTAFRSGGISDSYKSFFEAYHLFKYYGKPLNYFNNTVLLTKSFLSYYKRILTTHMRKLLTR